MTASRRRTLVPAAMAALLAAMVGGGQVGRAVHFAEVAHARCAEHGEPVHVTRDDAVRPRATPSAEARVGATPARDGAHAHDHCDLATLDRQRGALTGGGDGVRGPVACATTSGVPAVARGAGGRSPLRVAPKTSPPA